VRLRRIFVVAILVMAGTAALAFVLDYVVFRVRAAVTQKAYGSVVVNHYTAVLQKNGKTTLTFDPPQPWTCVNALFPHQGWLPCWYLSRHPDQRTDI
jgi:membrane associated rhomboid family serine protease